MVNRRGLSDVPKASGEPDDFGDGIFQFKGFRRSEPSFEKFLVYVEDLPFEPDASALNSYQPRTDANVVWFDEQLYSLLVNRALSARKALSTVKNCEDLAGRRGSIALHRIAHACKGHRGELRMVALRDAARKPAQQCHAVRAQSPALRR